MAETTRMTILSPEADTETDKFQLCRRLDKLDGKVIGLVENGFQAAEYYMKSLEKLLHETYPAIETVYIRKPDPTRPAPADTCEEAVRKCDAVIVGVGG